MPFSLELSSLRTATIVGCMSLFIFGVSAVQNSKPGDDVEVAYRKGLQVWRSTDKLGLTCSFCHAPDALEIAQYNFSDTDIHRRAVPHLGAEGADSIVQFIHAVRKKYGINKLLDPMNDRPLQPGGEVLPGASAGERDLAFGKSLASVIPTLSAGEIDTLAAAEKAKSELLQADPSKLRVGIPFNRISEDRFHGMEHATFAHWIADTALELHFPWDAYFEVQDAYLRDPDAPNFYRMLMFPKHVQRKYPLSQQMTNNKYRALLVLQHMYRTSASGGVALDSSNPVLLDGVSPVRPLPNPLFELGLLTHEYDSTPLTDFRFPEQTLIKKTGGPDEEQQLRQIRLPSLWAGWIMDQGLQRIDVCPGPRAARVLTARLLTDGPYPLHAAFMIAKKLVTQGFAAPAWNDATPQHFTIDFNALAEGGNLKKFEPSDAEARRLYKKLVSNSIRMCLFLYRDQLEKSKTLYADDPSLDQLQDLSSYVREADPTSAVATEDLSRSIVKDASIAKPYDTKKAG